MLKNKANAFHFVLKDEKLTRLPTLGAVWDALWLDELEAGLDYFMLDTAAVLSAVDAGRWFELVTSNPICMVHYAGAIARANEMGAEAVISGIELYRRRRLKNDPLWHQHGVGWSNRCTRAKQRALKMVEQESVADRSLVATG